MMLRQMPVMQSTSFLLISKYSLMVIVPTNAMNYPTIAEARILHVPSSWFWRSPCNVKLVLAVDDFVMEKIKGSPELIQHGSSSLQKYFQDPTSQP